MYLPGKGPMYWPELSMTDSPLVEIENIELFRNLGYSVKFAGVEGYYAMTKKSFQKMRKSADRYMESLSSKTIKVYRGDKIPYVCRETSPERNEVCAVAGG